MAISPLLQARLNNSSNYSLTPKDHEAIYKDLQKHANEVKPNEAKAKLIKQGPVKSVTSALKDTYQDTKNFKTAVKTGHLCDNSLGRLNDLGMKAGAVLIALYLATKQRSKTESIMQFVGGGTFFATMALWPKLALNLPAKKVHGFDIGQRYISAQGDKKDFFLDNQFLPWDAYSKAEMKEIGKRTGIDIDSENGEEKIRRKMQKTALQNRTLWMATAGFSTPLITSLIGNAVTPKIKDGVIRHGFEKAKEIVENGEMTKRLSYATPDTRNGNAIEALFNQYTRQNKAFDDDFYTTLAKMLQINAPEYKTRMTKDGLKLVQDRNGNFVTRAKQMFKDMDDANPIKAFSGSVDDTAAALKEMASNTASINRDKLRQGLKGAKAGFRKIDDAKVRQIMESIGEKTDVESIKEILLKNKISLKEANSILSASKENVNVSEFLESVQDFNIDVVGENRGRLKAFLKILNPVIGEKEESVYTKQYLDSFENFDTLLDLPYSKGKTPSLKTIHGNFDAIKQNLIEHFSHKASLNEDDYRAYLEDMQTQNKALTKQKMGILGKLIDNTKAKESKNVFDNLILKIAQPLQEKLLEHAKVEDMFSQKDAIVDKLLDDEVLNSVIPNNNQTALTEAIFGKRGGASSVLDGIKAHASVQKTNLESVEALRPIAANFERRVARGDFNDLSPERLNAARNMVYCGNISLRKNNGFFYNKNVYQDLLNRIYDVNEFDVEESVMPGIKETVQKIKDLDGNNAETYARAADLVSQTKTHLTSLFNSKHWEHIFIPAAIVLVVVTLLAQHFFGKIDNEYPEKKGGDK